MFVHLKKIALFSGFVFLLFFIADRVFFFKTSFLENTAATILYPFLVVSNSVTECVSSYTEQKQNYQALRNDYQKLREDFQNLLHENIKQQASRHYFEQNKELVEFGQRYNLSDKIMAKILIRTIAEQEHSVIINRGARDGVKKDMIALDKFQIVGRVSQVFDYYSKLLLITDQNCKIAAYTNNTNASGIVHGQNNIRRCKLNYVSHLFKIEINDLVLSSGQGLIFPEGFCLGRIVQHSLKEKELYHNVDIEPLINLETLRFCLLTDQSQIPGL
jgi:rod shape-determining protein MreC